jgi:hypothetical protein
MGKSEENREEMEKEQTSSGISREERENRLSSLGVRAPFRVLEDFFAIVKKRRKNENCGPFSLTFSLFSLLLLVSPKRDGKKKRFCFHCSFYTQQTQQFYNTKTVGFVMVLFPPCRAYLALHGGGSPGSGHRAVYTSPRLCSRVFTRRADFSRWTHVYCFSQLPHAPLHRPRYFLYQGFFLRIDACSSIQRRTRRLCSPSKDQMLFRCCARFP